MKYFIINPDFKKPFFFLHSLTLPLASDVMNFDNKDKYVRLGFSALLLASVAALCFPFICVPNQNKYEARQINKN